MVKHFENHLLWNQTASDIWTWYAALKIVSLQNLFSNANPRLTLNLLIQRLCRRLGWCEGAVKLSMPGCVYCFDFKSAMDCCVCSRCRMGAVFLVFIFSLFLSFLFVMSHSLGDTWRRTVAWVFGRWSTGCCQIIPGGDLNKYWYM